jgi:hypothetical protein
VLVDQHAALAVDADRDLEKVHRRHLRLGCVGQRSSERFGLGLDQQDREQGRSVDDHVGRPSAP